METRITITPEMVEWTREEIEWIQEEGENSCTPKADKFAQDFVQHLQATGGLSGIDMTGFADMSRDEWLQLGADIKAQLVGLHNLLCALAVPFAANDDTGGLASVMGCSAKEISTWADVYATFGPDAIGPEDRLDAKLWQAVLDTEEPDHYLERARSDGLGPTQIRRAAGKIKESKPPMYAGGATVKATRNTLTVHMDSPTEGEPREFRATVRVTERER